MVQIIVELNERLIDLPIFLLSEEMLLFLLVVILQLQLLVLWVCLVKKDLLRKLRDVNVRYGFY